jgi:monoamine oxidase
VGAGLAGLTAGYRLWQNNVPLKIIEASDRIGGRIFSKPQALGTKVTAELGGEFIDTGHKHIRNLAQEMGLTLVDLAASDGDLTTEIWFFNGRKLAFADIAQGLKPLVRQIAKDVESFGDFTYKNANALVQQVDRLSISQYLNKYCPDQTLRRLIEVAYVGEYGREASEQSALNLLFLIATDDKELTLYGESDERYTIAGGNGQLTQKLAEKLQNFISTGTALESIRRASDGRYWVSLRQGSASREETYAKVLLTLPFNILRHIDLQVDLPPVKLKAIRELGYGRNAKLITSYSDRLWRTKYKSNGSVFTDLGWQNTWEPSRYSTDKSGLITNYLGGNRCLQLSDQADAEAKKFLASFQQVFPTIDKVYQKALLLNWVKQPLFQGSYSCYLVGQYSQFHGVEQEPWQNLFFAGECCSMEAQGYMEGACATGETAAQQILSA